MKKIFPYLKAIVTTILLVGSLEIAAQQVNFVLPQSNQDVASPAFFLPKQEKVNIQLFFLKNGGAFVSPQSNYFLKTAFRLSKISEGTIANLSVFKSITGQTEFGVARYRLSLAQQLRASNKLTISFGISSQWNSLTVDRNKLIWDDQFDENSFEVIHSSNENINFLSQHFLDFSTGISFHWTSNKIALLKNAYKKNKKSTTLGLSINHLSKFGDKHLSQLLYTKPKVNLFFESTGITRNGKIYWNPQVFIHRQFQTTKVNIGGFSSRSFKSKNGQTTLSVGLFYTSKNKLSPVLKINMKQVEMAFSYDLRLGSYRTVHNQTGGIGLHFRYKF